MTELLSDERIGQALSRLPEWQRDGVTIERTSELASFPQAIEAVNRVGEIAENANHHPDIDIRFRTVTFRLSTHSEGGLTEKDITLAEEIDEVINAV